MKIIDALDSIIGVLVGAVGAGLWLGHVRARLDSHLVDDGRHTSLGQQEEIARLIVDREIKPQLGEIQRRLISIENKINNIRDNGR